MFRGRKNERSSVSAGCRVTCAGERVKKMVHHPSPAAAGKTFSKLPRSFVPNFDFVYRRRRAYTVLLPTNNRRISTTVVPGRPGNGELKKRKKINKNRNAAFNRVIYSMIYKFEITNNLEQFTVNEVEKCLPLQSTARISINPILQFVCLVR